MVSNGALRDEYVFNRGADLFKELEIVDIFAKWKYIVCYIDRVFCSL